MVGACVEEDMLPIQPVSALNAINSITAYSSMDFALSVPKEW